MYRYYSVHYRSYKECFFTVPFNLKECIGVLSERLKVEFKPVGGRAAASIFVGAFLVYLFNVFFWLPLVVDEVGEVSSYAEGLVLAAAALLVLAWYLTRKVFYYISFRYVAIAFSALSFFSAGIYLGVIYSYGEFMDFWSLLFWGWLAQSSPKPLLPIFMVTVKLVRYVSMEQTSAFIVFSSFIPLTVGLMLLSAGAKRVSDIVDMHERGLADKYGAPKTRYRPSVSRTIISLDLHIASEVAIKLKKERERDTYNTHHSSIYWSFLWSLPSHRS